VPDARRADDAVTVEHDRTERRFFIRFDDGDAELVYTEPAPKVIDIQHTYVPDSARGHHVGDTLAEAAFEFARERGLRVVPTCPFVRRWLAGHPDLLKLVDPRYATHLR
jgi:predicted GNAT family acetyltransferase